MAGVLRCKEGHRAEFPWFYFPLIYPELNTGGNSGQETPMGVNKQKAPGESAGSGQKTRRGVCRPDGTPISCYIELQRTVILCLEESAITTMPTELQSQR